MTNNKDLIHSLTDLGLSETESSIFINAFQYKSLSISSLARLTRKPRSTVHGAVKRLTENGYLVSHKVNNVTQYSAIGHQQLISLQKNKQKQLAKNIKSLEQQKEAFHKLEFTAKKTPIVNYYKTEEIIPIMYEKIRQSIYVRSIFDIDRGMKYFGLTYQEIAKEMRVCNGVNKRILFDSPNGRKYIEEHQRKNYELKIMKQKEGIQSDIMIMDNSVYHVSYENELIGIEIHDKTFFDIQCVMFDQLRESL